MNAGHRVTVIGLGNVVCSDDGLGVHAVRRLRAAHRLPPGVEFIEGGTAGLLLLPHLADADEAVLVDAVDVGAVPGTLVRLEGRELDLAAAGGTTVHDVGLVDLLRAARFSGTMPRRLVLHGAQAGSTAIGTTLSPPVFGALDRLVARLTAELHAWTPPPGPHADANPTR